MKRFKAIPTLVMLLMWMCVVTFCILRVMSGCAADPKPRALLTAAETSDEGPKNPSSVDKDGARTSTLYPSTAVMLRDSTETEPATLALAKPSSTTTVWSGPFDAWLDAAGIVTAEGIRAKTGDGAQIEADRITIDNKATLQGAAEYAAAIERQVIAMSADQRAAYEAQVRAVAETVRDAFPALADLILRLLIPAP